MDQTLLGEAAASLMDTIERDPTVANGKLLAVGIIAIIEGDDDDGDPMTFTRTHSTEKIHHRALGLFAEGLSTIQEGYNADPDYGNSDENDDDD